MTNHVFAISEATIDEVARTLRLYEAHAVAVALEQEAMEHDITNTPSRAEPDAKLITDLENKILTTNARLNEVCEERDALKDKVSLYQRCIALTHDIIETATTALDVPSHR